MYLAILSVRGVGAGLSGMCGVADVGVVWVFWLRKKKCVSLV